MNLPIRVALVFTAAGCFVADALAEQSARQSIDANAFRAAVIEAERAMKTEDFKTAEAAWGRAVAADPTNSPALFNQGVAQYRSGNLKGAAESFASASHSADSRLAAQSMFNQGNALYADVLAQLDKQSASTEADRGEQRAAPQKEMEDAIAATRNAFTHFKDAAVADPSDRDARVNAETAARLLKQLEELQQQKQQEQQEKQQNQDSSDQQNKDESEQQQPEQGDKAEQQNQPQQGDQQQQQQQEQKSGSGDKQATPEEQTASQDGNQPKPPEAGDDPASASQTSQNQQQQDHPKPDGERVTGAPLTKQEADQLLQAVRDREKSRRESMQMAQQRKQAPASKDW